MAFFVAPYPPSLPQDSNGGFLGLFNNPNNTANAYFPPTVAVEFDAFKNDWDPANTVNHVGATVDFKEAGLPQQAAVGFSGATGDFVERHQILSWSFESTLVSVAVVNTTGKCLSLFLALLLFLLFFSLLEIRVALYII
jgi:hypothetical protein